MKKKKKIWSFYHRYSFKQKNLTKISTIVACKQTQKMHIKHSKQSHKKSSRPIDFGMNKTAAIFCQMISNEKHMDVLLTWSSLFWNPTILDFLFFEGKRNSLCFYCIELLILLNFTTQTKNCSKSWFSDAMFA